MAKGRLGDKFTVTVKPGQKQKPADEARRNRYGDFPEDEELPPLAKKQTITFHDANWRFRQAFSQEAESNVGLNPTDYALSAATPKLWTGQADWTENQYMPSFLGFLNDEIDDTSLINDAVLSPEGVGVTIFDKSDVVKVTAFLFDEFDVFTGVESNVYRTTDECQQMPHDCAALGLTVRAGATTYPLTPATSKWQKSQSAQAKLDALLARQAGGESGLETQIANAELEVAESDDLIVPMPEFSNVWSLGRRTDWTEPGELRLTQRAGAVGLADGGHFYETFDTSDTVNFKVTALPDYTEAETDPSSILKSARRVRVYLVPQIWKAEVEATLDHVGAGTNETGGATGTLYAFAKTQVFSRWKRYRFLGSSVPVSPTNAFSSNGAGVVFDFGPPAVFVENFTYVNNEEFLTLPALGGDIESNADLNTAEIIKWFQADGSLGKLQAFYNDLDPSAFISPESGAIVVTNTPTPEGRIVGCLEIDGDSASRFYVWRKTENARDEVELMNGVFRPTGSFFASARTNQFSYYDDTSAAPGLSTGLANEDQHYTADFRTQ